MATEKKVVVLTIDECIRKKCLGRPKKYNTEEERLEAYRKSVREGAKRLYDKNKEINKEKRRLVDEFLQEEDVQTRYIQFLHQKGIASH